MVVGRAELCAALLCGVCCTVAVAAAAGARTFGGGELHHLPNISGTRADIDAFNRWFWRLSPRVNWRLATLPSEYGNGIFVTNESSFPDARPLKKGDVIIEVPVDMALCDDSIKKRPYGAILSPATSGISEENRVALSVVVERLLGGKSRLRKWLRVVPTATELVPPYRWTAKELSFIEPRSARESATQRAQQLRHEFDSLVRAPSKPIEALNKFVAAEVASTEGADASKLKITFDLFVWAKSLIDTRAWNIEGRKYFVPFADMFNHKPDDEESRFDFKELPHLNFRSQKFVHHHKIVRRPRSHFAVAAGGEEEHGATGGAATVSVLQVLSDRAAAPGEQLFESYGDNSNDIYFSYHGFVPKEGNKYDCQEVAWDPPRTLTPAQRQVLQGLKGLQRSHCVHFGEVPPGGLIAALIAVADDELLEAPCALQAVSGVDARQRPHSTLSAVHGRLRKCLRDTIMAPGGDASGVAALVTRVEQLWRDQYRALKAMVMTSYTHNFKTSKVANDEKYLGELEGKIAAGTADVSEGRIATALRFRIGRKKILNKLIATINARVASLDKAAEVRKAGEASHADEEL